jgi:hypothetical protein
MLMPPFSKLSRYYFNQILRGRKVYGLSAVHVKAILTQAVVSARWPAGSKQQAADSSQVLSLFHKSMDRKEGCGLAADLDGLPFGMAKVKLLSKDVVKSGANGFSMREATFDLDQAYRLVVITPGQRCPGVM